ncbi:MAG: PLP-dependent aminotransferase family protein, partial [Deltaproteobacteria bacterium]|nr:PLP-dependent aminotransferase family protein [Deltaproteobacteria bacterium]
MAIYNINKEDKTPYFRQLVKQTIHLINEGILKEGFQLPSSRVLAEELDLNRSTVFKAYKELWGLGYIDSSPGSYSIVRKRGEIANRTNKISGSLIDWDKTTIQIPNVHIQDRWSSKETINFCPLSPDPRITPTDDFRKCMNDVLREKGDSLLQYGDSAGYPPLREYISSYLSHHRICSTVDEIMITEGAQSALELITKLFAQKKWSVIVEKPTYSAAIPLFRLYGGEILEIPVNKRGMDLDILEEILKTNQPSFIYTMSNYQNPTGYSSTQKNREKLLSICEEHRLPLIEDGFTEDMRGTTLPIKSMASSGIVIYLGTFSK